MSKCILTYMYMFVCVCVHAIDTYTQVMNTQCLLTEALHVGGILLIVYEQLLNSLLQYISLLQHHPKIPLKLVSNSELSSLKFKYVAQSWNTVM